RRLLRAAVRSIFDCGCSRLKVKAGLCDVYSENGELRGIVKGMSDRIEKWVVRDGADETYSAGGGGWTKDLQEAHPFDPKEEAERHFDEIDSAKFMRIYLSAARVTSIDSGRTWMVDSPLPDLPKLKRIRITTANPVNGRFARGCDVVVSHVTEDGRALPIPN